MSAAILAKLKEKKRPKIRESIVVAFPIAEQLKEQGPAKTNKPVTIRAKIIDKTKAHDIDRDEFIKKFRQLQTTKPKKSLNEEPITEALRDENPQSDLQTIKKLSNVESDTKPKKLSKKIKLKKPSIKPEGPSAEPAATDEPAAEPATTDEPAAEVAVKPDVGFTTLPTVASEPKKIKKFRQRRKTETVIQEGPASMLMIKDATLEDRLGEKKENLRLQASSYYMNNREIFINFMTSLFGKYKGELEMTDETCERDDDSPFSPMGHQKIVRDYITQYTPYRGILLFHGLGSGKTCSSIAIAEGMKTSKPIIVMTPASLRMNYIEELKKCGDDLYRKNQYWEFINTSGDTELINTLSYTLSLPIEFIRKQGGAWLVNLKKRSNFKDLDSAQKSSLDAQLNTMIMYKYKFINYNGLRNSRWNLLTENGKKNPFDNSVVIIDEAHNFVSRIVNKLNNKDTLSGKMYEDLMDAQNAKIIMLTGTPIINYPNEIAIMFNILRGRIKTWTFNLTINKDKKVDQKFFEDIFKSSIGGGNIMDYIEYKPSSTSLVITRNPFGFVNQARKGQYEGVRIGERGELSDDEFKKIVISLLQKNKITVNPEGIKINSYKALPDTLKDFQTYFIDESNNVKNMNLFKRRIMGLASYFRDMYSLMPKYDKSENFGIVEIPMSNFQFGVYEAARVEERKLELANARKRKKQGQGAIFEDTISTYRIFSRAFCNFVFPKEIKRPLPGDSRDEEERPGQQLAKIIAKETADEDLLDAATAEERVDNIDGRYEADELQETLPMTTYEERIKRALLFLEENKETYLSPKALETYSPKFLNILENINDEDHKGLHLIYSQFRTLEGVGILKLVFEANGYAQFKLAKVDEQWKLNIKDEDKGKPLFALYTGTETPEEKEILRNVFNSTWKYIPISLAEELQAISSNNFYGEIIKVLMITASGAEGISLKNVRYVHITEPYWHPIRLQQVIGRARRICSHQDLPEEFRTVDVFLYLMVFSEKQLASDESIELRLKDKSKIDNLTPITSDQALFEIAQLKENITTQLLTAVKESSIDCALHAKMGDKEKLKCFSFGNVDSSKFSYKPSYYDEEADTVADINKKKITWKANKMTMNGVDYALKKLPLPNGRLEVFNYESYKRKEPIKVGELELLGKGKEKRYKYIPI